MEKVKLFLVNAWAWILDNKKIVVPVALILAGVVVGLFIGC
jgi:hypothetical protein